MRLYLVQHGQALGKERDPQRPLSDPGRADVERLANFLKDLLSVGRVMHSGKLRAQQTAEILANALAPGVALERLSGIGPKDAVEPWVQTLRGGDEASLLVGHLPFLGRLVARLVGGSEELELVSYQPGSMICLEADADAVDAWRIQWMIRPELLT